MIDYNRIYFSNFDGKFVAFTRLMTGTLMGYFVAVFNLFMLPEPVCLSRIKGSVDS